MPVFLIVILSVAAFFTLVALIRIKVRVKYSDELELYLKIAFVKIRLYPQKEEYLKLKDFRIDRYRKKFGQKSEKQSIFKKLKKSKKDTSGETEKTVTEQSGENRSLLEKIIVKLYIGKAVLKQAGATVLKCIRIDVGNFIVDFTTSDTARTAICFTVISELMRAVTEIARNNIDFRLHRKGRICIIPDFAAEKTKVNIDLAISLNVAQIIRIGISAIIGYMKSQNEE